MAAVSNTLSGETITFTTTVKTIWDGHDVVVADELYKMLKASVGILTLNGHPVKECMSHASYPGSAPECKNLEKTSIVLSKAFAERIGLQKESTAELTNTLTSRDVVLWGCGQDRSNTFGSMRVHKYVATAIFAGSVQTESLPGIFLNNSQMEYLNLRAHLRPLCGLKKFTELQASSPQACGIVKLYYKNQCIEAPVFRTYDYLYPASAVLITQALHDQCPGIEIGDSLRLCSRFDVEGYEEAEMVQTPPEVEKEEGAGSCFQLFRTTASDQEMRDQIVPQGVKNVRLKIAALLDEISLHAKELASEPELFVRVLTFIDSFKCQFQDTHEYGQFLRAMCQEEEILKQHQNSLLEILERQLLNQSVEYHNPPLLSALFTMGMNLKNDRGENCLHIMFRLKRGYTDGSFPACIAWMKEKTLEGKTPLHYLCQNGEWASLDRIGEKLRDVDLNDFVHINGNPFHELAENLEVLEVTEEFVSKCIHKFSVLLTIVEHLGTRSLNWFDQTDRDGLTPLQKMACVGIEPLTVFCSQLVLFFHTPNSPGEKEKKIKIEILTHLLSQADRGLVMKTLGITNTNEINVNDISMQ